jgi:hypothetical protein
MVFF